MVLFKNISYLIHVFVISFVRAGNPVELRGARLVLAHQVGEDSNGHVWPVVLFEKVPIVAFGPRGDQH